MWGPYLVEPVDKVRTWSRRTLDELRRLATAPDTGVRFVPGIEASRRPVAPPEWGDQLDGYRMCQADESPDGFVTGWRFIAPLVDMPTYLTYLERRLAAAGGTIEVRRMKSLGERLARCRSWSTAPGSAPTSWCQIPS
jgi:D-amino-acid oxidase